MDIGYSRLQAAFPPVLVALQPESDIDRSADVELAHSVLHSPPDRLDLSGSGDKSEFESVLSHGPGRAGQSHAPRQQHRSGIANSEWLEVVKQALQVTVGTIDRQLEVHSQVRNQIGRGEGSRGDGVEPLSELVDFFSSDGDACSRFVTAEAKEQITALCERMVKIEARYASSRSLAIWAIESDQHHWPAELFDETRRDDADDSRMPFIRGEDDAERVREIETYDHFPGIVKNLSVDLLTVDVEFFELSRDDVCVVVVLRK